MRITVNLPEAALKLADEGAARLCLSRSGYIALALAEKAKQDTVLENLPELLTELKALRAAAEAAGAIEERKG